MHKYRCASCGCIYGNSYGNWQENISQEAAFEDLPDNWVCPICSAGKDSFVKMQVVEITNYENIGTDIVDNEQPDNIQQKKNILKEIENTNQQIIDSKHNVYKKTKYWNQQNSADNLQTEALVRQIIEHLIKIEAKLDSIENKL